MTPLDQHIRSRTDDPCPYYTPLHFGGKPKRQIPRGYQKSANLHTSTAVAALTVIPFCPAPLLDPSSSPYDTPLHYNTSDTTTPL